MMRRSVKREFFGNVIPSMIAFAFTGVYAIVDGFFVGRNVGDAGLAAINVAYPLVALIQAAGTGLGMAGAIQIAINKGKKDEETERRYLGNAFVLLLLAGILLTGLLLMFYPVILRLFGASGEIYTYGAGYIRIIAAGAAIQVFSTGMMPIIRNYDGAVTAMAAMVAGFVTNIIFDWLFVSVLDYGVEGAAVATLMGQAVTVVPAVIYLTRKVGLFHYAYFPLRGNVVRYLLAIAASPFGLTLSPNIVIMIINKGSIVYGGDTAVSCYAVVSYVICVVQLLVQGVGDGAQPLIGRYYGSREYEGVRKVRAMAYMMAAGVTILCIGAIIMTRGSLAGIFGVSSQVQEMYETVILYFAAGLVFAAFLRVTTSYFYAVEQNLSAYILIYGEPSLLAVLIALVLPGLLGLSGVWIAEPVTQASLALAGGLLLARSAGRSAGEPGKPDTVRKQEGRINVKEQLTQSDVKKIKEEIEYRKLVVRKKELEAVKEARAQGDLSENFEYKAAKQDKNRNESRIRYLERMLKNARIISDASKEDEAGINNTVELYFEDEGETDTIRLVTSVRGNSLEGLISIESPLGKAVLGRREGDRVKVELSEGRGYYVVIKKIIKTSDDSEDQLRKY